MFLFSNHDAVSGIFYKSMLYIYFYDACENHGAVSIISRNVFSPCENVSWSCKILT